MQQNDSGHTGASPAGDADGGRADQPSEAETAERASAEVKIPRAHPALITAEDTLDLLGPAISRLAIGLLDVPMKLVLVAPPAADTSQLPSPPMDILSGPTAYWGHFLSSRIDQLCDALKKSGVNLLHAMDISSHALTRRLSDAMNLPYLLSVHRGDKLGKITPLGQLCYAIATDSQSLKRKIVAHGTAAAEQVHLTRPGLYPNRSVSCFSHEQKSYAIVATGELDEYTPFETVIRAHDQLLKSNYDCMLFVIGSGRAEFKLRKLARQLKISEAICFSPKMRSWEMSQIFRDADIVIYPGSGQTLETTVMEAMAAGAAVMAGGQAIGDFLTDAQTATFYRQASEKDLAQKLKMLLDEPEMAIRLATNAQEYLRKNHSPATMVNIMAEIYQKRPIPTSPLRVG